MPHPDGPVLLGIDLRADEPAAPAELDRAARTAAEHGVDLRLVCGLATLPPWSVAAALLDALVARVAADHPGLAVTTALYPGTTDRALDTATATASLVVCAAVAADRTPPLAGSRRA